MEFSQEGTSNKPQDRPKITRNFSKYSRPKAMTSNACQHALSAWEDEHRQEKCYHTSVDRTLQHVTVIGARQKLDR